MKQIDRTNVRYGRLVVIGPFGQNKHGHYLWLCQCDCGGVKTIRGDRLTDGNTRSCGCTRAESRIIKGSKHDTHEKRERAMLKRQYSGIRVMNKKKGFSDLIDFKFFVELLKGNCKYCGINFSKELADKVSGHVLKCNGIDRINSNKGYTKDNVVSCCTNCNKAKSTMTVWEFYEFIKELHDHLFSGSRTN